MQAQKFLVQSTVVPPGTTEEDITSNMFSKEGGKYSEEKKLKVVLISPPHSSFLLPSSGELKKDPCYDTSLLRDLGKDEIENIPQPHELAEDVPVFKTAMDANELGGAKDADGSIPADMGELKSSKDTAEPKLTKDFEELKSKLHAMDLKLREVFSPLVSFYWRQNLKLGLNTTIYHKIIFWKRAIEFLESCLIFERGIADHTI
ncbi:vesicle-associated protein 2-2-like isoform X1 [Populus trichocarpa]|uniref:vesicle-associated protein 2-2-like isoform X1 n=1 Tax=Populus trichocarpa TaxID=3694 RepID=UPI0022779852|nr:vesicle-associated protein 2-2-like isoform X1 [Populus trichocarpa]XP_052312204.1 vesicle-associated protein 2-2-like isoform X1 [Populus trichocarpa]XP_052312205.1 vesicle-associated protein 2-2-like isoform X1 [Populus trichocarpa]XP_052312206.1 vesicle-associated protein 2-2-like isoform X1 [Populus trichocarpa]XP_052312207.1 vesicle-associated protein 2-2-like isoform X1 [Populus trichocarpa]XP_052312208.1 vesicle-associated protein 2-2-like isoform X1 [Populus trichocarpa]